MPIVRCNLGGGKLFDVAVPHAAVPRIVNALRLPEIAIETWDEMPASTRKRMVADYEWLSVLLTKAKLDDKRYETGGLIQGNAGKLGMQG
jgi:hypothetical protein